MPDGTGAYELSKMAIAPELRGQGAGRTLLSAAIDHAQGRGASSLFLGSSRKLANAVHLYEALGFEHVAPETLHMPYARADVFMQLVFDVPRPLPVDCAEPARADWVARRLGRSVAVAGEALEQRLSRLLLVAVVRVGRDLAQRGDHRQLVVAQIDADGAIAVGWLLLEPCADPIGHHVPDDGADLGAGDDARLRSAEVIGAHAQLLTRDGSG